MFSDPALRHAGATDPLGLHLQVALARFAPCSMSSAGTTGPVLDVAKQFTGATTEGNVKPDWIPERHASGAPATAQPARPASQSRKRKVQISMTTPRRRIDFRRVADAALLHANEIVRRWLPNGCREGHEWIALNPTRRDARKGSFKVNLITGRWCDFATHDRGGDLISLASYLHRLNQAEAAVKVADMLGMDPYHG